ncbi:BACON domain-containing protein [Arcticibacterium luteifluviistationis]|uniref:BACON domain-containing protein n=1 Tax=Arcticibacterium luteifluviistationis TaxID=1784714 RepID=A0A2Z4G9L5_9BACT|nr:hypothetical protein [Arcticibacterium luteifluviistationis]AWV97613.1 hypothetical protein DJ013_05315 [Arcticibacterium luteifluviistationis]
MKFIELNSLFRNAVILGIIIMSTQSCKKDPEVVPTLLKTSTAEINLGEIKTGVSSNFQLTSEGEGLVIYALSSNKDWLVISTPSGVVTDTSTISISVLLTAEDLQEGYNEAEISVSPTIDGVESEVQLIKVFGEFEKTMVKSDLDSKDLGVIKSSQNFNLSLSKLGSEDLSYVITTNANWLNFSKVEGELTSNESIEVTVNTDSLSYGLSEANITVQGLVNGEIWNEIIFPVKVFFDNTTSGVIEGHTLSKDETWSGEIILKGTVTVPLGLELLILPGTKITIESQSPGPQTSITAFGSLIANGSMEEIIEFVGVGNWKGIESYGGNIELSYAYINRAIYAVYISTLQDNATTSPTIHHLFFENGDLGISLSSRFEINVSHLSFKNVMSQNIQLNKVNKVNLSEIDFAEYRYGGTDMSFFTSDGVVVVKNSNFYEKDSAFQYDADLSKATNTSLKIQNSFNFKTAEGGNSNGNTTEITDAVDSKIEGIGCGFTDRY